MQEPKKVFFPRATLIQKLKNRGANPLLQKIGRNTYFADYEEEHLLNHIMIRISNGLITTDHQILDTVENYANTLERGNPFTNGRPSAKWLCLFKKRHYKIITMLNVTEKKHYTVIIVCF